MKDIFLTGSINIVAEGVVTDEELLLQNYLFLYPNQWDKTHRFGCFCIIYLLFLRFSIKIDIYIPRGSAAPDLRKERRWHSYTIDTAQ